MEPAYATAQTMRRSRSRGGATSTLPPQETPDAKIETQAESLVRVSAVELSLTVAVQYEVAVVAADGTTRRAKVRVQFPDEIRAMLETVTWSSGATILESIATLGLNYLNRLKAAGLLRDCAEDRTFHLPLAHLRAAFDTARRQKN